MSDPATILEMTKVILADPSISSTRPWMTATNLSKRLLEKGVNVDSKELDELLCKHSQEREREIRYCYYPSPKTLDLLWAHVEKVGKKEQLPEIHRIDAPSDSEPLPFESPPAGGWFFLSHNYRDANQVFDLRQALWDAGFGGWMFEAEIKEGENIIEAVRNSAKECKYFIVYITPNSLRSVWVRKEFDFEYRRDRPRFIVFGGDRTNSAIIRLFKKFSRSSPPFLHPIVFSDPEEKLCIQKEKCLCRVCRFVEEIHSYFEEVRSAGEVPMVVSFPPLRADTDWGGLLKHQTLEDLLAGIAPRTPG